MSGTSIPERIRHLFSQQVGQHVQAASALDPGPRPIPRATDDPRAADEAEAVLAGLGGAVWAGDVVEIETSDPAFWQAHTFELTYRIEAVCRAAISDQNGPFTFTILFLAPDQGADVLFLEGDLPQTARAYLGLRGPDTLTDELRRIRDAYLQASEAEVTYELATDSLGRWTAYAAREQGQFWLQHGTSGLIPQSATTVAGAPYRDCSLYYGPALGSATWGLRLIEIGGFGHAFQAEILPLDKLRFWRRERPTPSGSR